MRILVLSHMYPNRMDPNAGRFVHDQVKALSKAGCKITVISPVPYSPKFIHFRTKWKKFGSIPEGDLIEGQSVLYPRYLRVPGAWFHPYACSTMYLGIKKIASEIIRRRKPDILHAHTATPDGYAAILIKKNFEIPIVCSLRGSDINLYPLHHKRTMKFTNEVISNADSILSVSQALRTASNLLHPLNKEIEVVYNGCDTGSICFNQAYRIEVRRLLGISLDARAIIFAGCFVRTKGVYELANSFVEMSSHHPQLHLIMLGDGPEYIHLKTRTFPRTLQKKVHLPGKIPHESMSKWLSAGDVFVFPSHNEGLPNAVLEAMSCGLPVIATKVGGIPEAVRHGESGMLINLSETELIQALDYLLRNETLAKHLGGNARKRIENEFSWRKNAERTLRIYERILAGKRKKVQNG